ncbi:hypothetical protein F5Y15DRAFT_221628 [Xylariaceae sp. FL0016]|nr:hypothetical protein F5Y15DRAFT_221628 [Xylariaceae sp. FL0016]
MLGGIRGFCGVLRLLGRPSKSVGSPCYLTFTPPPLLFFPCLSLITGHVMDWHDASCSRLDLFSANGIEICLRCGSFASVPDSPLLPPIEDRSQIRLLRIFPGNYEDPIRCNLTVEAIILRPLYEAVSYTWADETGNDDKCGNIFLADRPFAVTRNCENALRRIRLRARTPAVSVQMLLNATAQDRNPSEPIHEALTKFIKQRYFRRVWILQEVGLARKATVFSPDFTLPWSRLRTLMQSQGNLPPPLLRLDPQIYTKPGQLLRMLDFARECDAKDSRDKVFAILGLITDAPSQGLAADYSQSTEQVYIQVAIQLLKSFGLQSTMMRATAEDCSLPALPTWVPYWSRAINGQFLHAIEGQTGEIPPSVKVPYTCDGQFLRFTVRTTPRSHDYSPTLESRLPQLHAPGWLCFGAELVETLLQFLPSKILQSAIALEPLSPDQPNFYLLKSSIKMDPNTRHQTINITTTATATTIRTAKHLPWLLDGGFRIIAPIDAFASNFAFSDITCVPGMIHNISYSNGYFNATSKRSWDAVSDFIRDLCSLGPVPKEQRNEWIRVVNEAIRSVSPLTNDVKGYCATFPSSHQIGELLPESTDDEILLRLSNELWRVFLRSYFPLETELTII